MCRVLVLSKVMVMWGLDEVRLMGHVGPCRVVYDFGIRVRVRVQEAPLGIHFLKRRSFANGEPTKWDILGKVF